jgi:phospholipid-binding lipoprotein MlaA
MLESQDRGPGRGARRPAAGFMLALVSVLSATRAVAADAPKDPLEHLNRATYAFNDALDRMLARPAAKAYKAVVPEKARQVVSNFLSNLSYPTVIVNDTLQAKFKDAGADTARFLTNTVVGVGGLFDPATHFGLPIHDEDFGQTLGAWGVPAGPYLVLPFLGPSDFRDAPSKVVDHFTGGDYYLRYTNSDALQSTKADYGLYGVRLLDRRTELLATDETLQQAFDPYAVMRNAYVARREYLVRDGNIPEETYDEPASDAASPAPPAQQPAQQPEAQPAQPAPPPEAQPPPQAPEATAPREPEPKG